MGKAQPRLPLTHRQQQNRRGCSFFGRCSRGLSRIVRLFSFKCVFILLLSVGVSLSAFFSVVHFHHRQSGFDAKDSIKQSATVQAYFRLEKPVSFLLPQIRRLEYDIYNEIGVPCTQVAILSMHESNGTHVVFGVLPNPMNSPINPVSLSVLKSSLLDLFTQRANLTLTTPTFGMPSSFEILKFPGGITLIPKLSPPVIFMPQVLFNFTLHNSVYEIEENFLQFKAQLKSGLQLMPYESVFVQVTNKGGSTQDPPITVQASVVSNLGSLEIERLKQLAQEITPANNLGLDNSLFGKVKEISLSSFLYHTLDAPTPSPAPSPDQDYHEGPTISPSPSSPCSSCVASSPSPNNGPSTSPAPAMGPSCGLPPVSDPVPGPGPSYHALPPHASPSPAPLYPVSGVPPDLPPFPAVSYGLSPHQQNGNQKGLAPPPLSPLPSSSSSATGVWGRILFLFLVVLITLHVL